MALRTCTVVNFLDDNCVEAVPTVWIKEDENICLWPSGNADVSALMKHCEPPNKTWTSHKCRIFQNSTFGNNCW